MKHQMLVTAFHMVNNLAATLYRDAGQCLMELIRNSLVASMPNPDRWDPRLARIEISISQNHPLTGGPALVVLDHGCGMTDPALARYFLWLGTSIEQLRQHANGTHKGASQKGIGRLAALALNENCLVDDPLQSIKHGYYLMSRTSQSGQIRFVQVIPELIELERGIETNRFVSPSSTEARFLNGIQGSFTAIIVPTPIFKSAQEIYDAIKWLLPRERDKMFDLQINGKTVQPPPLESEVNATWEGGNYRARLGVKGPKETGKDGVWLCDSETGIRVACCQELTRVIPDPLWYPELVGDIFAPGLLRHQNTARSALAKEFTRKGNKEWSKFLMFLVSEVIPKAKQLVDRDDISGDAADALDDLVEMFNDRFGEPEEIRSVRLPPPEKPRTPPPGPRVPGSPKESDGPKRYVAIRVRDKTYRLYRGQPLDPFVFAQPHFTDTGMILVNVRGGYRALPKAKQAMREHCLMHVLNAIGKIEHRDSPVQAMRFANEIRAEFLRNGG